MCRSINCCHWPRCLSGWLSGAHISGWGKINQISSLGSAGGSKFTEWQNQQTNKSTSLTNVLLVLCVPSSESNRRVRLGLQDPLSPSHGSVRDGGHPPPPQGLPPAPLSSPHWVPPDLACLSPRYRTEPCCWFPSQVSGCWRGRGYKSR